MWLPVALLNTVVFCLSIGRKLDQVIRIYPWSVFHNVLCCKNCLGVSRSKETIFFFSLHLFKSKISLRQVCWRNKDSCLMDFLTFSFSSFFRNRMTLMPSQAFYLLINNAGIASMSLTMAQVYKDHKDEDGFLYMTYASQEMFGHCESVHQLSRWCEILHGGRGGGVFKNCRWNTI